MTNKRDLWTYLQELPTKQMEELGVKVPKEKSSSSETEEESL